jgi:polyhydroxybutyrate depolymerase
MKRALAACAVALALGACAGERRPPAQSARFAKSGDHEETLQFAGGTRRYILHLPPDYARHVPLPVLIAFHGGGANGKIFQLYSGLDAQADSLGWAVIYPDGTGHFDRRLLTWNAGTCCGSAMSEHVDDVGFTLALLADLAKDLDLDRTRVYATGHSNGAMMAYRLAGAAGARLAAIAAVAGPDMTDPFASSGPPVPVLHVHSVDDPRATYSGGESRIASFIGGRIVFRPVDETLARWRKRDGCSGDGKTLDERTLDSHRAELVDFGPCAGGADVELWRLHGSGHGWPGGTSPLPERLVGPNTRVIHAAEEIFRFLSRFTRADAPRLTE